MDVERREPIAALLLGVWLAIGGCSKPPGEHYLDTSIRELVGLGPGQYELYAPFDIPARGPNLVFLRQGKDIIIAAGDSLELKIQTVKSAGNFSLIGRRMGQPKLWFAVDGIIARGALEPIGHRLNWQFPSYEAFDPSIVEGYAPVDLARFDYDQERPLRQSLLGKKTRITGGLRAEELEPGQRRYLLESRNLKLELTPVGHNLAYFLDLVDAIDTPLVAYGRLVSLGPPGRRAAADHQAGAPVIGGFSVDFLRYSRDVLVRNTATAGS